MKFLLAVCLLPLCGIAQSTKKKQEFKPYAKISVGALLIDKQELKPAGFISLGAAVGDFAMLGVGGGVFAIPGNKGVFTPVGAELTLTNRAGMFAPIFNLGGYKPITTMANIEGKAYLTAGAGIAFFDSKKKGGAITVNYSQLKYDQKVNVYAASVDERLFFISVNLIL